MISRQFKEEFNELFLNQLPTSWIGFTPTDNRNVSNQYMEESKLNYFTLRFLEYVKIYVGYEALKMPFLDLIQLLKYNHVSFLEKQELMTKK